MLRLSEERVNEIVSLYDELGSVWAVAKAIGRCGQSVHEVLERRGIIKKQNIFTESDYEFLKDNFLSYRADGNLQGLADIMGRTKPFICRKAKDLGLTSIKRTHSAKYKAACKERDKGKWNNKPHPRGMLGKKHSEEVVADMRIRFSEQWNNPYFIGNSPEYKKAQSDRASESMAKRDKSTNYSRTKKGWFLKDGVYIPMRSSWEFNYAHYLNKLLVEGKIKEWEYEATAFKFPEFIFGCRTYSPDFKVTMPNDEIVYHEVKGWMDKKSVLKLSLMKKHFKHIKLKLINEEKYKKIEKSKRSIPGWGTWFTEKSQGVLPG